MVKQCSMYMVVPFVFFNTLEIQNISHHQERIGLLVQ